MTVAATRTSLKVLWQDGRIEELPSFDLIPHHNLDDLDCWCVTWNCFSANKSNKISQARPGDFVQWNGDGAAESRVAIVQSIDPVDRTATVRWFAPAEDSNEGQTAVVSCLELDPVILHATFPKFVVINAHKEDLQHGKVPNEGYEVFGVQRGDIVFIHPASQPNGSMAPWYCPGQLLCT